MKSAKTVYHRYCIVHVGVIYTVRLEWMKFCVFWEFMSIRDFKYSSRRNEPPIAIAEIKTTKKL